jgi:phosphoglycolate phosphatase
VAFESVEAVLFDKDGTLADSMAFLRSLGQKRSRLIDAQIPGVQEPLLMAFGLEGERLNPAGLLAAGTRYENEIAAAAYVAETGRDWQESLHIVKTAFQEADRYLVPKAKHTPPFEGMQAALQALAAAGLKLGILSADTTANVREFVTTYGLDDMVQLSLGTAIHPAKPDPALFYQACTALHVSPAATLYIGDSPLDLQMTQSAKAAGFVGVDWDGMAGTWLDAADARLTHLSQLVVQ